MRCAPVVGRTPQTTTVQNNSLLGLARRTAQVAIPVRGKGCCSSRTRAMRSMAPQAQVRINDGAHIDNKNTMRCIAA